MTGKTCYACEHRVLLHEQVFCRRFPPQVYGGVAADADGSAKLIFNSHYPMVNPEMPCGEYKFNAVHMTKGRPDEQQGASN